MSERTPAAHQIWGIRTDTGQHSVRVVGVDRREQVYFKYLDEDRVVTLTLRTFRRRAWFLRTELPKGSPVRNKEKGV